MVKVRPPPKPALPEPEPGMALVILPSAHYLWLEDSQYYDQLGRDPLQQARLWLIEDTDARVANLREVIEAYPKQMHRRRMLDTVAKRGDEPMIRCFIETGMRLHPEFRDTPWSEEEEQAIEDARETDPLDVDDNSVVPIHTAVSARHHGCVKLLIEEGGAPVDSRDAYGATPLMRGADQPELVRYLLDKGADPTLRTNPNTYHKDFVGPWPDTNVLEYAASGANVEVLRMLLDNPTWTTASRSTGNEKPVLQVTPLCIERAAAKHDGFGGLKLLLERAGYPMEAADGKTKAERLTAEQRETIPDSIPPAISVGQLESMQLLLSYEYSTDLNGSLLPFDIPDELHRSFVYGA